MNEMFDEILDDEIENMEEARRESEEYARHRAEDDRRPVTASPGYWANELAPELIAHVEQQASKPKRRRRTGIAVLDHCRGEI